MRTEQFSFQSFQSISQVNFRITSRRLSHSFSRTSRILLICVHLLATLRLKLEHCEAVDGSNKSNQRNITKKPTRQNQTLLFTTRSQGAMNQGPPIRLIQPAARVGLSANIRMHIFRTNFPFCRLCFCLSHFLLTGFSTHASQFYEVKLIDLYIAGSKL